MAHVEETLLEVLRSIARNHCFRDHHLDIRPVTSRGANYTSKLYLGSISSPGQERLNIFAKIGSFSEKIRTLVNVDQLFRTEHIIYTELVKIWDTIQEKYQLPVEQRYVFPKYYDGHLNKGCETVVLEDLTADGYSIYDRFKSMDWEHASKSVETLARYHALSFILDKDEPEQYRRYTDQLKYVSAAADNESNKDMWAKMVEGAVQSVKEGLRDKVIKFFENIDNEQMFMDFHTPRGRPVLVHGDYKVTNLFFKKQNGVLEMLPIDYQTVHSGCPVSDLIYFVVTTTDGEFRRYNYQPLVDHYHSSLADALRLYRLDVEEVYPRTQFDEDLKQMMPTALILGAMNLPLVLVEEASAPRTDTTGLDSFVVQPTQLYAQRLNELVTDLVNWNVI